MPTPLDDTLEDLKRELGYLDRQLRNLTADLRWLILLAGLAWLAVVLFGVLVLL